ncbi:MAG: hypothetical protein JWQ23_3434 [Herminiimonas sp.]|nr:hypothetical protein [Herminiimonas sp.]
MKVMSIIFLMMLFTGCSGIGTSVTTDTSVASRSARNLCEVMRSKEPYRPNECGEFNRSYKHE